MYVYNEIAEKIIKSKHKIKKQRLHSVNLVFYL